MSQTDMFNKTTPLPPTHGAEAGGWQVDKGDAS